MKIRSLIPIVLISIITASCSVPLNGTNTPVTEKQVKNNDFTADMIKSNTLKNIQTITKKELKSFKLKAIQQESSKFPCTNYSDEAYLLAYIDMRTIVNNGSPAYPYSHCLSNGKMEGRLNIPGYVKAKIAVSDNYEEKSYLLAFPDIHRAVVNGGYSQGYDHYNPSGQNEGRLNYNQYYKARTSIVKFDEATYLSAYPDVAAAVQNGSIASGFAHYIGSGFSENRLYLPQYVNLYVQNKGYAVGFDEEAYLATWSGIRDWVNAGNGTAYDHYLLYGRSENRFQSSSYADMFQKVRNAYYYRFDEGLGFDETTYLLAYPDILAIVNNGSCRSGLQHYILSNQIGEHRLDYPQYAQAKATIGTKKTISLGKTISLSLNGAVKSYYFMGMAGYTYKISQSELDGGDAYLKLFNPDGTFAILNDDSVGLDSAIIYPLTTTGLYRIDVSTYSSALNGASTTPTGSFDLRLNKV